MASTSSSTALDLQLKTWDAFISFRGKDIRYGLLSHLSKALEQKQINAFIDDKLRKGEDISQALLEIIEDSYVSVVIFSKNYADSPWCLDELVKILECKGTSGQIVLPVFYKVDPIDVQELRGSFGMSFHKLKELKDCLHKVEGWSNALMVISNLSGWDSKNIKLESELVEEIVKGVMENLSQMLSDNSYNDKLVGIDLLVKKIESLLQIGLINDNRTIGIWGMGGIGKTTIANAIFSRNMTQFDSSYFVMNVREEINNQTSITLRDKIISQLLGEKGLHINTPHLPIVIRRRLQRKKVIIVFDDVHDSHHLKLLAGECDLFNKGSRIIVTSRDRQVLKNICPTEYIHEVEKLIDKEALQLFSLYAFKQNHPKEGYWELSHKVIRYAQGNPLALIVLGSNLYDKDMEEWENELQKLKNIPDMKIMEVLKISYDGLDRNEKNIFLDIACFLKGRYKHETERLLESCGFFPKIGMSRLLDKSLISISVHGDVHMHDLLQQMGKDIVYEECKQPEGRSRLCNSKDISYVLTKDKGTRKVEGILLDMSEIEFTEISSTAFKEMYNLRFLKFYCYVWTKGKLLLPNGLEFLPEELRYLQWDNYPLESLPLKFCPNNLVELHMPQSKLKQLWNRDKPLANLKVMDLSYSLHLIRIAGLSGALNLKVLKLRGCESLVEILSSDLQYLYKLTGLDLGCCTNLCSFPSCLGLKSLELLNLQGCSKLRKCPEIPFNMKILWLDETAIEELPSSVEHCSQLVYLSLEHCTRLVSLLRSISNLTFLKVFKVQGCLNVKGLPDNLGDLESLQWLDISRSGIKVVPSSINQLRKLKDLLCRGCDGLTRLPLLTGLYLRKLDLGNCGILEIPESVGSLVSLEYLYLDGNNFERIPASIKQLSNLKELKLTNCTRLRYLPELACLEMLNASNCFSLKSASTSFLSSLDDDDDKIRSLDFGNCINLDSKIIMDNVFMESHMAKQQYVKLCVPGVEAPEGMRYQNKNGYSLSNIKLDDRRIIGFSFCSVFYPKLFYPKLFYTINCKADFEDESGYSLNSNVYTSFLDRILDHEDLQYQHQHQHVTLWYENLYSKERFTYASFQFYIEGCSLDNSVNEKFDNKVIMKCGVHPIYEDDCVGRDKKRKRNDDRNEDEEDEEDQPSLEKTRKHDDYLDLNLSLSLSSTSYEDDDCVGRDQKRKRNDDHNEDEQDSLDLNLSLSL